LDEKLQPRIFLQRPIIKAANVLIGLRSNDESKLVLIHWSNQVDANHSKLYFDFN